MNGLIDTHAHIYLSKFREDIGKVIDRAKEAGIERIFMPNIDSQSIEGMLQVENDYPGYCIPMMGIHPCYIKDNFREELETAQAWLDKREFCAIGEIGIDLYWDKTYRKEQIEAFEMQVAWAKELGKPVIIHCRDSMDLTIELVKKLQDGRLRGIFHCFTGSLDQARAITDLGFLLGIGGVSTFKNGGLDKVIPFISLEHLVLETDSPYLAPTPFRGKRNEPAYLINIAQQVAGLLGQEVKTVAKVTGDNALNLFEHV